MCAGIVGWAIDFVRAAVERPLWARILLRVTMGRYAYREFIGLMDELNREGFLTYMGYELYGIDYHNDLVPFDYANRGVDED